MYNNLSSGNMSKSQQTWNFKYSQSIYEIQWIRLNIWIHLKIIEFWHDITSIRHGHGLYSSADVKISALIE